MLGRGLRCRGRCCVGGRSRCRGRLRELRGRTLRHGGRGTSWWLAAATCEPDRGNAGNFHSNLRRYQGYKGCTTVIVGANIKISICQRNVTTSALFGDAELLEVFSLDVAETQPCSTLSNATQHLAYLSRTPYQIYIDRTNKVCSPFISPVYTHRLQTSPTAERTLLQRRLVSATWCRK